MADPDSKSIETLSVNLPHSETLINGNFLIARSLAAAGVANVFVVVGISVTSLATRAIALGIRFIAFHNEQSDGYAASAYGYLTGRPSFLLTVSDTGCVHGLARISNAGANAWLMVMISSSSDHKDFGMGDFQEPNQIDVVKPFAKFAMKVTHISEILDRIFEVIHQTGYGRSNGCYLDISTDVLHQTIVEYEVQKLLSAIEIVTREETLENLEIEKATDLLRHAERPLIVFGKDATFVREKGELKKLIETSGIPFLPTQMGKGLLPDTHELAATAARSHAIVRCDVALVVGSRLNWLLHFGEPPKWSKDVKFILVDKSYEEIELRKPFIGLVGDAKRILNLINKEIKDNPFCFGKSHPWVDAIQKKAKENVGNMEAQLAKVVVSFYISNANEDYKRCHS